MKTPLASPIPHPLRPLAQLLWGLLLCATNFHPVNANGESEGRVRAFQSGDRVCFLGDSITKGGRYQQLLELFYTLRFPDRPIEFLNCGIGGDRASSILSAPQFRIETDILSRRPTIVSVMLGMNDVERSLYAPNSEGQNKEARAAALENYRASIKTLVQTLQKSGCHVILLSPSIYEESTHLAKPERLPGVNTALSNCARILREISTETGSDFVDVHSVMQSLNQRQQATNPAFSITGDGQSWNDRVHPGPTGHFVIAQAVLAAQGLLGEPVSLPLPSQRVPGFPEVPAPLFALSQERRRLEEDLRESVTFRYAMAKEGLDPSDTGLVRWLENRRMSLQKTGLSALWVDRVLQILAEESELQRRSQNIAVKIRAQAAARPVEHTSTAQ